jgi:tripartite-type tricarboxylate transporter receptor subunit TctC
MHGEVVAHLGAPFFPQIFPQCRAGRPFVQPALPASQAPLYWQKTVELIRAEGRETMIRRAWALALVLLSVLLFLSPTRVRAADEFHGKTVTIFNWTTAGGGYDAFARMLARTLPKYLPGSPTVIVKSLEGAGGFTLMAYLLNKAAKDGTEIAIVPNNMPLAPLLTGTPVAYDPKEFGWLGSLDTYVPILLAWGETPFHSIDDVLKTPMKIGATAPKDAMHTYALGLNELIGTQIQIINGYPGTQDITLAMERGEVDGLAGWCWTCMKFQKPEWVAEKKARVLLQIAVKTDPELDAMGIPSALALAKTDEAKQLLEMVVASAALARPFTAPPGLPPERLALLRQAFEQSAHDPDMIEEGVRTKNEIHFTDATTMMSMIEKAYTIDPDRVGKLRAFLAN